MTRQGRVQWVAELATAATAARTARTLDLQRRKNRDGPSWRSEQKKDRGDLVRTVRPPLEQAHPQQRVRSCMIKTWTTTHWAIMCWRVGCMRSSRRRLPAMPHLQTIHGPTHLLSQTFPMDLTPKVPLRHLAQAAAPARAAAVHLALRLESPRST